jgi:subtilisin family serine protease
MTPATAAARSPVADRPAPRRRGPGFAIIVLLVAILALPARAVTREGSPTDGHRLVVGLTDGADDASLARLLGAAGARIAARIAPLQIVVVEVRPGTADTVRATLRRSPVVRYAELDPPVTMAGTPNDEYYVSGQQWNIDRVHAPEAWDLLPPGGNTTVAVIDTGIDYGHPEFAGRISPRGCDQYHGDCLGSGGGTQARDDNGHGTHVAGIIGATTNNRIGIASVAAGRVTILPVKVLSRGGGGFTSDVLDAVVYAVDQGAKVINMSLGAGCGTGARAVVDAWRDAISYAEQHDTLIVMAAGNDGGCWEGNYPASDARVLSVAATDIGDSGASFTSRGSWVRVAAPGVEILSTVPVARGSYAIASGTSMATPHVAAEAALLYQVPGATKAKVMEWITSTCDPALVSVQCGGRINVYRAVALAVTGVDPATPPPAPVTATSPVSAASSSSSSSAPASPPGRFTPPARPAGFTASEATQAATAPAVTGGTAANVAWNGAFWLSAPLVTVGVCEGSDAGTRAAADAALRRLAEAVGRGLAWQLTRDDGACDAAVAQPKLLITRAVVRSDARLAAQTSITDQSGAACDTASGSGCWVGVAAVAVNPPAFDQLADEQQAAVVLRELARALGLGPATSCDGSLMVSLNRCPGVPPQDLGADDIASLNEVLAATLPVLQR